MITLPLSPCLDPTIKRAWLVDEEAGIRTPLLTGTDMLILKAEIKRLSFSIPFDWTYKETTTQ